MKKSLIILLALVVSNVQAQTTNTTTTDGLLAYNTSTKTTALSYTKNYKVTRNNNDCMNGYVAGAYVFGFAGGALIGYPLGTAIGGGDPEWLLAGIGAGCLAIAIPLSIIGQRKCNGRVSVQKEQDVLYAQNKNSLSLNMVANRQGIGLALNF